MTNEEMKLAKASAREGVKRALESSVPAPALGYSILANLGDEKQLTVQCYVDSEEDLASINAKLDKAMAVIDRQKAKYRLKDLCVEIEKMERTLRQLEADLARLEEQHVANKASIANRIVECNKTIGAVMDEAHALGRAKPRGANEAQVAALKKEIESLREQANKVDAERAQARDNAATNIERYHTEIKRAKEQVAECEAIIGKGG